MDIESMAIVGRIAERLLVVLFGGFSLAMGWHLYIKGVEKKQVAEIKHDNTTIKLKDVGPGAFFCVLGAGILVTALAKPLVFSNKDKNPEVAFTYGLYIKNGPPAGDVITSINTILNNVKPEQMALNAQWKTKGLERALSKLAEVKESMLMNEFQTYNKYLAIKNDIKSGKKPKFASNDEEKDYLKIEAIETNQFGQEP